MHNRNATANRNGGEHGPPMGDTIGLIVFHCENILGMLEYSEHPKAFWGFLKLSGVVYDRGLNSMGGRVGEELSMAEAHDNSVEEDNRKPQF